MNRILSAVALAAIVCGVHAGARGASIAPGIRGHVFHDMDASNSPTNGEGLANVAINLFRDVDGNGVFSSSIDTQVGGSIATDESGFYNFPNLDVTSGYFVQRPAQTVQQVNLSAQISTVILPGSPRLVIDAFENNQAVKGSPATPIATSTLHDTQANILGKERDLYVEIGAGAGTVELRSNAFGVQVLQFDNASGVVGHGVITWDGKDMSASSTPSLGLGDIDLTSGGEATGFLMKLGIDATGVNEKAHVRIFNDSATEFSEVLVPFVVTGGAASVWTYIPFSELQGNVSPNDVNAIQMILGDGAKSIDAQIGAFSTIGPVVYDFDATAEFVPEPSSLLLSAAGLLGLVIGRRRRA